MTIARFDHATINRVVNGEDDFGQSTTIITPWFNSIPKVSDVANSVRISEKYRVYADLVNLMFNFTPNLRQVVDNQDLYSITWRGYDWRITDVRESNDKMKVTLLCYRNDPSMTV